MIHNHVNPEPQPSLIIIHRLQLSNTIFGFPGLSFYTVYFVDINVYKYL